jgi:hypothetical protein
MPKEFAVEDRRTLDGMAGVVDEALNLAEGCGWSYALAYLISERVPPRVIQRLLSGNARTRAKPKEGPPPFTDKGYGWKGRNRDDMVRLFEALRKRRPDGPRNTGAPRASRSSMPPDEKD